MNIEIITPDVKLFEGEGTSVKLPGKDGGFEILNNHAPIISTLTKGKISIDLHNNQKKSFDIQEGIIEMKNNNVIILVN